MQKASLGIAFDEEITWTAHRVIRYLEAVLEYENALPITQKGIADALEIHRQQVNLAFKLLLQKGLVEKIEIPGLRPVFRLNPNYGWRGKHTTWRKEIGKAQPLVLVSKNLVAA
jgi:DNA-binding transcriptional regulator GbsR (MarR family)